MNIFFSAHFKVAAQFLKIMLAVNENGMLMHERENAARGRHRPVHKQFSSDRQTGIWEEIKWTKMGKLGEAERNQRDKFSVYY